MKICHGTRMGRTIISKLSNVLCIFYTFRHALPTNVKLILYDSLSHSRDNYCQSVWGNISSTNIHEPFIMKRRDAV